MMSTEPAPAGTPPTIPSERTEAGCSRSQEQLRRRLHELGFDDVRFAAIVGPATDPLREWLAAGMHADMQWMERSADKRLNPDLVLPGARSVIMLGVSYWSDQLKTQN